MIAQREHRRKCSLRAISIIKAMPHQIDFAIAHIKRMFAGVLDVAERFDHAQKQLNIYLRNALRKNDRRHAHVAVVYADDGSISIPYSRPYGEYRDPRRKFA